MLEYVCKKIVLELSNFLKTFWNLQTIEFGMVLAFILDKNRNIHGGRSALNRKVIYALFFVMSLVFVGGCGGGGGSGSATTATGTGTVSLDIADAKPFIEGEQPDELWVAFDAVLVHTSGGGWVSLVMPETPFEINLLAFSDGLKTKLATPTLVPSGHVTQIRFEIKRAYMLFYRDPPVRDELKEIGLDVPSGTLRTDKQIDWTLTEGGAMSLTVHFDLSQSIVQTGPEEYKLKPVLHLFNNEPDEAATICGSITADSFTGDAEPQSVYVSVEWKESELSDAYIYTEVTVEKSNIDPTDFCIYWLVPLYASGESYTVRINNGVNDWYEVVPYPELKPGDRWDLKSGTTVTISTVPLVE
jgi:hypothetical protein